LKTWGRAVAAARPQVSEGWWGPGEPPTLPLEATAVRHVGQWVAAVLVLAALVMLGVALFRNPYIDHAVIARYQFSHVILRGLAVTVELTVVSMIVGIVVGVVLALFRETGNIVLRLIAGLYIWAFRGTPLLVQILLWGNFALLFRHLDLGVPFTHLILVSVATNSLVTVFVASILALGLNEGAYMAEVVRGGILSVDHGQIDAALSLGMTRGHAMRKIVLPQAVRVVIPPTGNQLISLLKASSLVSVIAGGDLLTVAENIYSQNFRTLELLIVASVWYLAVTTVANSGPHFLETRFRRGGAGAGHASMVRA
ncbi:MAG: amino acid ABC transporter permease, partial [Acidimicrobiales bacterium]